ncbi:peptidyl-prolyl cis-trans isomerase [Dysgonomonas sp. 520]|nr:peptidyl-prolyl cis-trans isomerase [Dysgonomonas sp. 520]
MSTAFFAIALVAVAGVLSCSFGNGNAEVNEEEALVTVNGRTLYLSDLKEIIPSGIDAEDSIKAAESYIRLWINDELMYEKAQKNVADKERIDELVNNYRQSLTVFTYQEQLLKERFSNQLSDNVLKKYYEENLDRFKLQSNLIKGLFLKIPSSSDMIDDFRRWYKSNSKTAIEGIEKNHLKHAVTYDFFYDRWMSMDEMMTKIPYTVTNSEEFLKKNKSLEVDDSTNVYLLYIKEYALTGTTAPFEYVKPQVMEVLINQQKANFLKEFEEDLYNQAIKEEKITYYYKKDTESNK